jgi:hypothetical protein
MRSPAVFFLALLACDPKAPAPPSEAHAVKAETKAMASFRFPDAGVPMPEETEASPILLTATDGTALTLTSLGANAVVDDPLAWTELRLTFKNPENRVLEGRFQIQLPDEADIARFAMKVHGDWQEGEVVERQRARRVYEDFLHRRQDPALLEHEAGDQFSARVFPIQPHGEVEIVVAWSEAMDDGEAGFTLPLRGLPMLPVLDLKAQVVRATDDGGTRSEVIERHERSWKPTEDFVVPGAVVGERIGVRSGDLVVARVRPMIAAPPEPVESLFVLVDSSASRAFNYDQDIETVGALVAALAAGAGPGTPVGVATFDQVVTPIFEGNAGDFGAEDLQRMRDLLPLGASDPAGALAWYSRHQAGGAPLHSRMLMVTDGVATAGGAEGFDLRTAAAGLREAEVDRLDVLASGGLSDRTAQLGLVNAGLPHDGLVIDASIGAAAIAARLSRATVSDLRVEVEGADWVWPETLDALQRGDEAVITAQVPPGQPVVIRVGGEVVRGSIGGSHAPLVERIAASSRIDRLVHLRDTVYARDADMRALMEKQATALSLKNRVLSPWTSMLVLETEWDYARYGIDRASLASVMSVGPNGLEVVNRATRSGLKSLGYLDNTSLGDGIAGLTGGSTRTGGGGLGSRGSGIGGGGGAERSVPSGGGDAPIPEAEPTAATTAAPRSSLARREATDEPSRWDDDMTGESPKAMEARSGAQSSGPRRKADAKTGKKKAVGKGRADNFATVDESWGEEDGIADLSSVAGSDGGGANEGMKAGGGPAQPTSGSTAHRPPPTPPAERISADAVAPSGDAAEDMDVGAVTEDAKDRARGGEDKEEENKEWDQRNQKPAVAQTIPEVGGGESGEFAVPVDPEPPAKQQFGGGSSTTKRKGRAAQKPSTRGMRSRRLAAWTGTYAKVQARLADNDADGALALALAWREAAPGEVLAQLALGDAFVAKGNSKQAARAFGSVIDLFPSRADLRRAAGNQLEALDNATALALAIDTYRKAVAQRPDHPTGHRQLAFALARAGEVAEAYDVIFAAWNANFRWQHEGGIRPVLREDIATLGAVLVAVDPSREQEVVASLGSLGLSMDRAPSTRFVLTWETDANDVDLHVHDGRGNESWFANKRLPTGGALHRGVFDGYGPECFTLSGDATAWPYRFEAHYYRRGPMGYGVGKLQIIQHDGEGGLRFDDRPYVVMADDAWVGLGTMDGPLSGPS